MTDPRQKGDNERNVHTGSHSSLLFMESEFGQFPDTS